MPWWFWIIVIVTLPIWGATALVFSMVAAMVVMFVAALIVAGIVGLVAIVSDWFR